MISIDSGACYNNLNGTEDVYSCEWSNNNESGNHLNENTEVLLKAGSVSATVTDGTFDLCLGGCTEGGSNLVVEVTGGTAPYNIQLSVTGFPIPIPFGIDVLQEFIICEGALGFDPGADPIEITIPGGFFPVSLEVTSITDDTGCNGTADGTYELEVIEVGQPEVPDIMECIEGVASVDLTMYDDTVLDGSDGEVIWLTADDVGDEIDDPEEFDVTIEGPIYAVIFDDPCYSEIIEIPLDLNSKPIITPIGPISNCGPELTLPDFGDLFDIDPPNNPEFYLDAGFTDGPFFPGDDIDISGITELFVTDGSGSDCFNSSFIEIIEFPIPEILFPLGFFEECGFFELPDIVADDAEDVFYNTEEDMSGTSFQIGDEITLFDGIDELFVIAISDEGCIAVELIQFEILEGVSYSADLPETGCDFIVLPEITPNTGDPAYFSSSGGGGTIFRPGDTITFEIAAQFTDTLNSLFLLDPNQQGLCATEEELEFEIQETPAFDLMDIVSCGPIALPVTSGISQNAQYSTSSNFLSSTFISEGDLLTQSQMIFFRDSTSFALDNVAGCVFLDTFLVDIVPEPFIGLDSTISICQGFSDPLNFIELLSNPDGGGQFNDIMQIDFLITDSQAVDVDILAEGSYDLIYTIEQINCPIVFSTLTLNVVAPPFQSMDVTVSECEGIDALINLPDLIGNPPTGGQWIQISGSQNVNLATPESIGLQALANDTYVFEYAIEGSTVNPFCNRTASTVTLDIIDAPDAGDDQNTTICKGEIIDLFTIIDGNADAGGMFESSGLFLNNNLFDTNPVFEGDYTIDYIVLSGSANCDNDTSTIFINLSNALTAGIPVSDGEIFTCGDDILLSDFINSESPGGTFFLTSDLTIPLDPILDASTVSDSVNISYILSSQAGCDPDTTNFTINSFTNIAAITSVDANICQGGSGCVDIVIETERDLDSIVVELTFQLTTTAIDQISFIPQNGQVTFSICDSDRFEFLEPDIYFVNEVGIVDIALLGQEGPSDNPTICNTAIDNSTVEFLQNNVTDLDFELCPGETQIVDGIEYDSSAVIMLTNALGCDSIVNLNLDFFDQSEEMIDSVLCTGQVVEIFNITFDTDTIAILTFPNASVFGCDSIVSLDLEFGQTAEGDTTSILCPGEFLDIDGVIFDENNLSGIVPFAAGSVFGCDSLTNVSISFDDPILDISETLCANDFIMVGNDIYDINNDSGTTVLINQAISGCDSIVNVALDFFAPAEKDTVLTLCEDESVTFGTTVFDINNDNGQVEFLGQALNACDSFLNVTVNFLPNLSRDSIINLCQDEDIIIGGMTFNATNNMGTVDLASVDGCDSLINVLVQVNNPSAIITSEACPGDQMVTVTVSDILGIRFPLTVEILETNETIQVNMEPINFDVVPGNYTITLDDGTCQYSQNIDAMADDGQDLIITAQPQGDNTFQLGIDTPIDIQGINWLPSGILDCFDCPDPLATIDQTETVTLEITDSMGCLTTQTITLMADETVDPPVPTTPDTSFVIYVPNIINVDNPNDGTFVLGSNLDNVTIDNLTIFDRWGSIVFENENFFANIVEEGWNGYIDNSPVEQGVYVVQLQYVDPIIGPIRDYYTLTIIR